MKDYFSQKLKELSVEAGEKSNPALANLLKALSLSIENPNSILRLSEAIKKLLNPIEAPVEKGAVISKNGLYRYSLWRIWDESKPKVMFIMLNPSTADGETDDPTIRRCMGFARSWGFGGILVGNLYAYRATNPKELYKADEPQGKMNPLFLSQMAKKSDTIVCAWGDCDFVKKQPKAPLIPSHAKIKVLGLNKSGTPKHPLYVPANVELIDFPEFKQS